MEGWVKEGSTPSAECETHEVSGEWAVVRDFQLGVRSLELKVFNESQTILTAYRL